MTKDKWIEKLRNSLSGLSKDEIEEIISDYNEYFYEGASNGRSEDEISEALGDPQKLGKQLKADTRIKNAQANMNVQNVLRAIFAIVTLSLFNIIVMLGPITAIIGIIFGLAVAGVAFLGGGIISFFATLIFGSSFAFGLGFHITIPIAILLGLCLSSLGIALIIADFWFGKWIFAILIKYFRFNFDMVKKTVD